MGGRTPEETDSLIDAAIRRADAAAAAELFEEAAVFVMPDSGAVIAGRDAIREAFTEMLSEGVPDFEGQLRNVIVAGDIALVLSDWRMTVVGPDGAPFTDEGTATDVMRRQSDGTWLFVIDNPAGAG